MPDPTNPDLLFAAVGEPIGSVDNGVYETTDGGAELDRADEPPQRCPAERPSGRGPDHPGGLVELRHGRQSRSMTLCGVHRERPDSERHHHRRQRVDHGHRRRVHRYHRLHGHAGPGNPLQPARMWTSAGLGGYDGKVEITSVGTQRTVRRTSTYQTDDCGPRSVTNPQGATAGRRSGPCMSWGTSPSPAASPVRTPIPRPSGTSSTDSTSRPRAA